MAVDIGTRIEPLVDDLLIQTLTNAQRVLHMPERREVVFEADAAWETEIADAGYVVDYETSLRLDAWDYPHIAYCAYDASNDKRLTYTSGRSPTAVCWPR